MTRTALLLLVALAAVLLRFPSPAMAAPRIAPSTAALAEVRLIPERPLQGRLFVVELEVGDRQLSPAGGTFAGEPLHFEPAASGAYRALAAMPVEAAEPMPLVVRLRDGSGRGDSVLVEVPVAAGNYRMERLSVAPRFGLEPDGATAARMAAEAERAREVSRRSRETPRLWGDEFARPRPGRITSGFGNGREFNGRVQSRHMGTDFAGAVGAPVHAVARGVVALVDEFFLGGRVVYIDHGAGLVSGYLHLSRTDVAAGDTVTAGQVIGGVGATGRVTGPHLHWLVRYGTITVDPMSLLELLESSALGIASRAAR
jgi:murein DD-endopeptidase MepM/ murein hydrolase activator NlpD